jgi:hypothetical protein
VDVARAPGVRLTCTMQTSMLPTWIKLMLWMDHQCLAAMHQAVTCILRSVLQRGEALVLLVCTLLTPNPPPAPHTYRGGAAGGRGGGSGGRCCCR